MGVTGTGGKVFTKKGAEEKEEEDKKGEDEEVKKGAEKESKKVGKKVSKKGINKKSKVTTEATNAKMATAEAEKDEDAANNEDV